MPNSDAPIVQGILISDAARIVENAFASVLGMDDDHLSKLSPDDKFGKYCDPPRLRAILDFVRTNQSGGLPSMTPNRTILTDALTGITTDSAIRLLIKRTSDFAFFFAPN
jgi:hypothetical protein